jgi:hypothetical protein
MPQKASSEFEKIFARLRSVLVPYADRLSITEDSATRYCLAGRAGPAAVRAWGGKMKKPIMPVAWVEIGKAYVSFHLMAIYGNPPAVEGMSKELQARQQGKTCFNFKVADEALFQELERVTERACSAFKKAGFIE